MKITDKDYREIKAAPLGNWTFAIKVEQSATH